ncbi:hypothetical protein [Phenylobacterium sp.]|uniref:hypothetical protein n=1 Tax=Phenylobacterium sp. TaxID=1871053 RepID=UPI002C12A4EB|nr:hypothetical protein [Phenylobacterium sp.]HVI30673.1 hypothetical protein [Phenylobacterium sp.]
MNRSIFTVAAALGALAVQSSAAQPAFPVGEPWFPDLAMRTLDGDALDEMITQADATSDYCLRNAAASLGELNLRVPDAYRHRSEVEQQYAGSPCMPVNTPVTSPADLSAMARTMPAVCAPVYQAHASAIDEAAALNAATAQVLSTQQTCTKAWQAATASCDGLRQQYEMYDPARAGALFGKLIQALDLTGLDPTAKIRADAKSAMQNLGCPNIP